MPLTDPNQKLSFREKVGYGLGDTATNLVWRTLMVFLPIFYTDVFGITAAAVGTLLLVVRILDGVTDFGMGLIADRTNTRWGKFRPWVLWMAVPFGVMTVLTFTTFDLSYAAKLIYAYVTYIGLILVFTASNVPYSALTGVLSGDPVERTSVSSYRFFFAFLGGVLVQGLNIYLVAFFGQGDDVEGYKYTMMFFAGLAVILFVITFLSTTERVQPPPRQRTSLKQDFKDLFTNRAWVVLFFIGVIFVTFTTLKQGVTLYYFKYFVGDVELAASFMVIGTATAMISAALTRRMSVWFGKRRLFTYSFLLGVVSSGLLYFAGPGDIAMIYLLGLLMEFCTGPIVALFFAMLGDAADYSEWNNHRRATGLVYSAGTLAIKFGGGIAGALTGWLLNVFGYQPNVEQTAQALEGIKLLISVVPAFVALLGIVTLRFYPIDDELLRRIQVELTHRKEGTTQ